MFVGEVEKTHQLLKFHNNYALKRSILRGILGQAYQKWEELTLDSLVR
jgi:hypothetical protein